MTKSLPLPTHADILELVREYQATRNLRARNRVVEAFLPLCYALAEKTNHGHAVLKEDLVQIGALSVMAACETFTASGEQRFSSYVWPIIRNAMNLHVSEQSAAVRIPKTWATDDSERQALKSTARRRAYSLDQPLTTHGVAPGATHGDLLVDDSDLADVRAENAEMLELLECLAPREMEYLRKMFLDGETYGSLAAKEGVVYQAVQRRLSRAVAEIREAV